MSDHKIFLICQKLSNLYKLLKTENFILDWLVYLFQEEDFSFLLSELWDLLSTTLLLFISIPYRNCQENRKKGDDFCLSSGVEVFGFVLVTKNVSVRIDKINIFIWAENAFGIAFLFNTNDDFVFTLRIYFLHRENIGEIAFYFE